MGRTTRLEQQAGRHALVDGIPFALPVNSEQTPALMAAFTCDAKAAARLMPGNEVHPLLLFGRALLVITVVDYRVTDIGKYIEYSIAVACTHGRRPAPPILPLIFQKSFGVGQYVVDLPVSSEVSVKGGKGIWGMPKHQAPLDFDIGDDRVAAQYELDGKLAMRIEVDRPKRAWLPLSMGAANYCAFRGMLMKSYINFKGKIGFSLLKKGSARLVIGDHPRMAGIAALQPSPDPLFAGYFPDTQGLLDDHFECWFISSEQPPTVQPEGMESVFSLGLSQEWPPDPVIEVPNARPPKTRRAASRSEPVSRPPNSAATSSATSGADAGVRVSL